MYTAAPLAHASHVPLPRLIFRYYAKTAAQQYADKQVNENHKTQYTQSSNTVEQNAT